MSNVILFRGKNHPNVVPFRGLHQAEQIAESILTKEIEEGIIDAQKRFEAKQKADEMLEGASPLCKLFGSPILEHGIMQQIEQFDWSKK